MILDDIVVFIYKDGMERLLRCAMPCMSVSPNIYNPVKYRLQDYVPLLGTIPKKKVNHPWKSAMTFSWVNVKEKMKITPYNNDFLWGLSKYFAFVADVPPSSTHGLIDSVFSMELSSTFSPMKSMGCVHNLAAWLNTFKCDRSCVNRRVCWSRCYLLHFGILRIRSVTSFYGKLDWDTRGKGVKNE